MLLVLPQKDNTLYASVRIRKHTQRIPFGQGPRIDGVNEELEKEIRKTLKNVPQKEDAAKAILKTLGKNRIIQYEETPSISLLGAQGRILAAIIENDSPTTRKLAIYLNITEPAVAKSLKILIDAGLIKKQKIDHRNVYLPMLNNILSHREIVLFLKLSEEKPF